MWLCTWKGNISIHQTRCSALSLDPLLLESTCPLYTAIQVVIVLLPEGLSSAIHVHVHCTWIPAGKAPWSLAVECQNIESVGGYDIKLASDWTSSLSVPIIYACLHLYTHDLSLLQVPFAGTHAFPCGLSLFLMCLEKPQSVSPFQEWIAHH